MSNQPLQPEWIERIFMRLHGRFGNTFFNKYKIGTLNADGEDAGIVNAKATWAHDLAGISPDRIKAALETNYDRVPDCDLFKANCYIRKQVEDYKALPAPADMEASKRNAEKLQSLVAEKFKAKTDYKAWAKVIVGGARHPSTYPNYDISLRLAKEALAANSQA